MVKILYPEGSLPFGVESLWLLNEDFSLKPTLHQAFPIVAAALGEKLGVSVRVEGQTARTDGDNIVLPAYDGTDRDYQLITWGYLAHEAAHLRFTNFKVFSAACTTPLRKALLNLLEDVRIERHLAALYPGTRLTLEKTVNHLVLSGGFSAPRGDAHPAALLQAHLLFVLRAQILGQTRLEMLANEVTPRLNAALSAPLVVRLTQMGLEVKDLKSTAEVLDLTDRILEVLSLAAAAAGRVRRQAMMSEGTVEADDASHSPKKSEHAVSTSQIEGEHFFELDPPGGAPEVAVPLGQLLEATEADLCEDLSDRLRDALTLTQEEARGLAVPIAEEPPMDPLRGQALLDKAMIESGGLARVLRQWIETNRMTRPLCRSRGQRVDPHRVYRIGLEDPRVFKRQGLRKAPDAAVHLLVDRSPSMSARVSDKGQIMGRRIDLALEACLSLGLALEGLAGVNLGITAFPGKDGEASSVYRILAHGASIRARCKAFAFDLDGSTPLAEAMSYAGAQLLMQKEPRKILLVLTDGIPDDPCAAQKILARCKASGIEVVGMGLGIEVQSVFERALTVRDVSGLGRQLHRALQTLLKERI